MTNDRTMMHGLSRSEFRQAFRGARGFTLLELMLSMALAVVVSGATFAMFVQSNRVFNNEAKVSRVQQSARVALDVLYQDLYNAGIAMPDQLGVSDEAEMVFTANNLNRNDLPDTLQFRTNHGLIAYLAVPVSIAVGSSIHVQVTPETQKGFHVQDWVVFFDLDRSRLEYGRITGVSTDALDFTVDTLSAGVNRFEQNTMIMSAPFTVTYAVGQEGVLYRCEGEFANCGMTNGEMILDNVEDFQVTFLVSDASNLGTVVNPGLFVQGDLEARKRIRAVKVDLLVRAAQPDRLISDFRKYTLGNRTTQPFGTDAEGRPLSQYKREAVSLTVNLPNVGI